VSCCRAISTYPHRNFGDFGGFTYKINLPITFGSFWLTNVSSAGVKEQRQSRGSASTFSQKKSSREDQFAIRSCIKCGCYGCLTICRAMSAALLRGLRGRLPFCNPFANRPSGFHPAPLATTHFQASPQPQDCHTASLSPKSPAIVIQENMLLRSGVQASNGTATCDAVSV
jgi:hypothetical protein